MISWIEFGLCAWVGSFFGFVVASLLARWTRPTVHVDIEKLEAECLGRLAALGRQSVKQVTQD